MKTQISPSKSSPTISFQSLIHPYSLDEFANTYWDEKELWIQRDNATYYQSLLTIAAIDRILDYHRPTGSSIRVVKNQEPLDKSKYENTDGSLNLNQIYAAYADGYTLVINEVNRFWEHLKRSVTTYKIC